MRGLLGVGALCVLGALGELPNLHEVEEQKVRGLCQVIILPPNISTFWLLKGLLVIVLSPLLTTSYIITPGSINLLVQMFLVESARNIA